ncbi:(4Fe-4S)-binding protein [Anaerosphaera multitolerans]|uniref:Divergent 4Fe-4S mono-cluster domain-containing protein n=1 Tax=Anaerosphaera multitolerans TaxID=2487351 RepID=A0A437S5F3_9FIRM|nr:(4Fe-4S)-binding protein [Anaerosphaera multitolerans]RVU54241.1 hypothetical protein EF514_08675 [Anaerosphaera multitolerans]
MNEATLLSKGYRKYEGENIDVYFNIDICQHSGNCVRGDNEVFDTERKPWIIPLKDHFQQIQDVINTCPSGALKYKLKDSDEILP